MASRILIGLLVPPAFRDEIAGDLAERFAARVRSEGGVRARVWLWGQLVRMRPIALRRAAGVAERVDGERSREVTKMSVSTGWWGEVRHSMRSLRLRSGFSATVILTVALAVGATTSVFSVVNGVLLRPLDFPEPDRLVRAWQTRPSWLEHPNPQLRAFGERFSLSVPTFRDWHEARTGLESFGILTGEQWIHQSAEGADFVGGLTLTSGVFEALGVEAALGRTMTTDDDEVGAPGVVVLSHSEWRDRFGADPEVLGASMSLDGLPYTVVGVMPEGFLVPGYGGGVWTSLPESRKLGERDSQSFTVLGRLAPSATIESVETDLVGVQERLAEAYPDEQGDRGVNVRGLLDTLVGGVRSTLLFLLAAVGLVLVIACVNIANMLSVNGLARRRELAVKAALGASSTRLVRGLLTESAVLAGLGGAGGLVLAVLTLPLLTRLLPSSLPRAEAIGIDARVLLFGVLVTAVTTLVVGMLPALQAAGTQPKQMMAESARGVTGGRLGERIRSALVVTEIALAFVLLVGATLLATSFSRLWNVERGFATAGLLAMWVPPHPIDYPEPEDQRRFRAELRERLVAIPGVRVSTTNQVPLGGSWSSMSYHVDRPGGEPEEATVTISVVGDDYFDVMGIALLEGRSLAATDVEGTPLVGVVNQALADRYWPGESALGHSLRAEQDDPPTTIVGVARNVRHQALHEPAEPKLYVPAAQNRGGSDYWVLRTQGDPAAIGELARAVVREVSSSTAVRDLEVLEERIAGSVAVPRFRTYFVLGLAGMATILALLGVYGVVSFAVSQRRRELAVRMAIGAHPRDVVAGTLSRGFRLSVGGIVLGLLIAWQGSRLVEEFLFEVDAVEPLAYAAVAVLVGAVSVLASFLPARRASRVDPVSVLNTE
ncbi:MAG TPA: ADOP family duplicated permease [Longimicrobiales bacterium]|nr:ADOP family duplicated permease [Longimicrobiales bacterium]